MSSPNRYEIIDTIAKGDFATVYRARDHELNRDVAIKQIHQQFLDDPRQLERYWQEAQLVASLHHPNIMTIYDVVRERGWLILELAQGSLQQLLNGNPIDLKDLKFTLSFALHALQFMHEHGIVHGDVKPSNLLVDQNNRVKLGDFGIARRMAGDDGSVVKGTTKYMAPEVVSDQFGEVGPQSDLYSLGFTAYELMCGNNFESLFPGLNMYGRDRQIAWMMWHSAADRRAPEINRVLEGVPPELVRVIEGMIEKDPARRYQSAAAALADLQQEGAPPPVVAADDEGEAESSSPKKRALLIGVLVCSLALSIGMAFLPSGTQEPVEVQPQVRRPKSGKIVDIVLDSRRIFVSESEGAEGVGIDIDPEKDRIRINDQRSALADLEVGDQITIQYLQSDDSTFMEIEATRELAQTTEAVVEATDTYEKTISVIVPARNNEKQVYDVGDAVPITLNGKDTIDGNPVRLSNLHSKDRLAIVHRTDGERSVAISLDALRELVVSGSLVEIQDQALTFRGGAAGASAQQSLPVADDCQITLNGQETTDGHPVAVADLRPNDQVSVTYDSHIHRIEAFRDVSTVGTVSKVDVAQGSFSVAGEDGQEYEFKLIPNSRIVVEGVDGEVQFSFLREGDPVTVQRRSPDPTNREAVLVTLSPEPDSRAWVVVIANDTYESRRLPRIQFANDDADSIVDTFLLNYRVPPTQLLYEKNATRVGLENSLVQFLNEVPPNSQLIVYFLGHGHLDKNGNSYLAPMGFDERNAESTGVNMKWLLQEMENCGSTNKMLVLDTTHEPEFQPPALYPSAAEIATAVRVSPTRPVSSSVNVLVSNGKGQVGLKLQDEARGLFGAEFTKAIRGAADKDRDHRVSTDELFTYLENQLARHSLAGDKRQQPELFPADATPPRLNAAAKAAVSEVLDYDRVDQGLNALFAEARKRVGGEPDAGLAYALLLLEKNRTKAAFDVFEAASQQHPESFVAHHALAWQFFMRKDYDQGIDALLKLVKSLPAEDDEQLGEYVDHAIAFAGKLVGYGVLVPEKKPDVTALNEAIKARGKKARETASTSYRELKAEFDRLQKAIADSDNESTIADLKRERDHLRHYVDLDFGQLKTALRMMLDR